MKKRRGTRKRALYRLGPWILVAVGMVLVAASLLAKPSYTLSAHDVATCLIPYTKLTLALSELNDTLGARNILVIYTPCGIASCSNTSKTLLIPLSSLRETKTREIDLGRSLIDNIVIELETGETIPATRVTSTGLHGSSLLFAWQYPSLKAILYVGLESNKAVIHINGLDLASYRPPRGCSLTKYGDTGSKNNDIYLLQCTRNIFSTKLLLTKDSGLFTKNELVINDYYCPGTGRLEKSLNISLILMGAGFTMFLLPILRVMVQRGIK